MTRRVTRSVGRLADEGVTDIEMGLQGLAEEAEAAGALVGEGFGEAAVAAAEAGAAVGTAAGFATGVGEAVVGAAVLAGTMDYAYNQLIGSKRGHNQVHGLTDHTDTTDPVTPDPKPPRADPRTPASAGPRRAGPADMPAKRGSGRGGVKRGPRATKTMPRKRPRKQAKPTKRTQPQKAVRLRKTGLNKGALAALTKSQVHGIIKRPECSWIGFQSHGGSSELFDVLADGILRRLLARFKIVVNTPDTNMLDVIPQAVPSVNSFTIGLRRANADTDGSVGATVITVDLTPSTGTTEGSNNYKDIVKTFGAALKTQAVAGYFPISCVANNSSGTAIYTDRRFGSAFINMSVYSLIRMRNITPNDNGDDDMSKLSTNPIDGKMYTLNGDTPRLREDVMEGMIGKFNDGNVVKAWYDSTVAEGINYGPQGTTALTTNPNGFRRAQNDIFSVPVEGKRCFQRVLGEKQVLMAPGTGIKVRMLFKHKGTLENLLKRFAGVYASPGLGTVKMFALQQVFKAQHGVGSGETYHNDVKVEYEIDRWARCGCALAAQRRIPAEKRVVASSAGV